MKKFKFLGFSILLTGILTAMIIPFQSCEDKIDDNDIDNDNCIYKCDSSIKFINNYIDKDVRMLHIDKNGQLWIGTYSGISVFSNHLVRGVLSIYTIAITSDKSGVCWFGGNGLFKYEAGQITSYTIENGLVDPNISAIAIDNSGTKWIGTWGGGVSRYNDTIWTSYTQFDILSDNFITCIKTDMENNVWIGTRNGGVNEYNGTIWKKYSTIDGLVDNYVTSIIIDKQNNKWFGTYGGGLSMFDGITWKTYLLGDGSALENIIQFLELDLKGYIWIGTSTGLYKYDGSTFTAIDNCVGSGRLFSIAADSINNIWI